MQTFIVALLVCSVTMSILALLYMASTPFWAKRYSEKGRYYVWLIILAGLIIPFRPQFANAPFSLELPPAAPPPSIQMSAEQPIPFAPLTPQVNVQHIESAVVQGGVSIQWWQIAFTVWLAGLVIFIFFHAVKHYRFIKTTRRWSVSISDERISALLGRVKSEMGISRNIPIYLCTFVGSPMMIGLIKPRILLPTIEIPQDELCFILKHELVHYKRKDLLYKHLVLAATALHWFNPVAYLIANEIAILCEISCDAEVLQSADIKTRQSYGETIIGVVQYQSNMKTALSTHFFGGKNGMSKRISSIMDTRRKKWGATLACVIMVSVIAIGGLFAVRAQNPSPEYNDAYFTWSDALNSVDGATDSERHRMQILMLESDIERQLVKLYGVIGAKVNLSMPLPYSEFPQPTAAVVLTVTENFQDEHGEEIAILVARNVDSLEIENVIILDQHARTIFCNEQITGDWNEWLEWFDSLPPEQQAQVSVHPPQELPSVSAPGDLIMFRAEVLYVEENANAEPVFTVAAISPFYWDDEYHTLFTGLAAGDHVVVRATENTDILNGLGRKRRVSDIKTGAIINVRSTSRMGLTDPPITRAVTIQYCDECDVSLYCGFLVGHSPH